MIILIGFYIFKSKDTAHTVGDSSNALLVRPARIKYAIVQVAYVIQRTARRP